MITTGPRVYGGQRRKKLKRKEEIDGNQLRAGIKYIRVV